MGLIQVDGKLVETATDDPPRESRRQRQRRLKRPPGRPRNPALEKRFNPTDEQREIVKLLAGYAIPHERIAQAIRNPLTRRPIGINTLRLRFEAELEAGRAEVDTLLANGFSKRLREANPTILIWVSKNLWGWKDVVEQQGKSEVDLSIQIKPEELPKLLEQNGLPPMILGRDVPTIDEPPLLEGNGLAHDGAGSDV
jgi:hypothetical protein